MIAMIAPTLHSTRSQYGEWDEDGMSIKRDTATTSDTAGTIGSKSATRRPSGGSPFSIMPPFGGFDLNASAPSWSLPSLPLSSAAAGATAMATSKELLGLSDKERLLMKEIRACQSKAAGVERKLQQTKVTYALALQKRALAQADVEEAIDSKRSLCHQLLLLMSMTEDEKYNKMLSVTNPTSPGPLQFVGSSPSSSLHASSSTNPEAWRYRSNSGSADRQKGREGANISTSSASTKREQQSALVLGNGLLQGIVDGWGKTRSFLGQPLSDTEGSGHQQ